jgi:hypothetical protein
MVRRIFILDVPENRDVVRIARDLPDVKVYNVGPYFAIESTGALSIDRRSAGVRHAVWYSYVAGLEGYRIAQWDKDALVLEAR